MQPVVAAASRGRVEFQAEIVPADKPVEGALGVFVPPEVGSGAIGFQAGRDGGLGLDGLLVEIGASAAAAVEAVAANGAKVTLLGHLQFGQPAEGLESPVEHGRLSGCLTGDNQGVGELGIIVGEILFKPLPVGVRAGFEALHEAGNECLAGLVDEAVAAQPAQVFMDADQTEGPGPR